MNNRKQSLNKKWLSGLSWVLTTLFALSAQADPLWTRLQLEQLERVAAVEGNLPDRGYTHRLEVKGADEKLKLERTDALLLEELIKAKGRPVSETDLLIVSGASTAQEVGQALSALNASFEKQFHEPLIVPSVDGHRPFFQVGEVDAELTSMIDPDLASTPSLRAVPRDRAFVYHGKAVQLGIEAYRVLDKIKALRRPRTLEEVGAMVGLTSDRVEAAIQQINANSVYVTGLPLVRVDEEGVIVDKISLQVADQRRAMVTVRDERFTISPKANAFFDRYKEQVAAEPIQLSLQLTPAEHVGMSLQDIEDAFIEVNTLAEHYTGKPVWSRITVVVPGHEPEELALEKIWVAKEVAAEPATNVCAQTVGAQEAGPATQTVTETVQQVSEKVAEKVEPARVQAGHALQAASQQVVQVGRTVGSFFKRAWDKMTEIPPTGP